MRVALALAVAAAALLATSACGNGVTPGVPAGSAVPSTAPTHAVAPVGGPPLPTGAGTFHTEATLRTVKGTDIVQTVDGTLATDGTATWTLTTKYPSRTETSRYRLVGSQVDLLDSAGTWESRPYWHFVAVDGIQPVLWGAHLPTQTLPDLAAAGVGWQETAHGYTAQITEDSSEQAQEQSAQAYAKAAGTPWTDARTNSVKVSHGVAWKDFSGGQELPVTWQTTPAGGVSFTVAGGRVRVVGTWAPAAH